MKIIFIRHGKTAGNLEKRYIGTTDESLCDEGKSEIKGRAYPDVRRVICSPMKRCIETAALIYPDIKPFICNDLRECDFGDFENKNYSELNGNADYQRWIDSGGEMPFPDRYYQLHNFSPIRRFFPSNSVIYPEPFITLKS